MSTTQRYILLIYLDRVIYHHKQRTSPIENIVSTVVRRFEIIEYSNYSDEVYSNLVRCCVRIRSIFKTAVNSKEYINYSYLLSFFKIKILEVSYCFEYIVCLLLYYYIIVYIMRNNVLVFAWNIVNIIIQRKFFLFLWIATHFLSNLYLFIVTFSNMKFI